MEVARGRCHARRVQRLLLPEPPLELRERRGHLALVPFLPLLERLVGGTVEELSAVHSMWETSGRRVGEGGGGGRRRWEARRD